MIVKQKESEFLWAGDFFSLTGYSKANREIIFALEKETKVRTDVPPSGGYTVLCQPHLADKIKALSKTPIQDTAPFVRFLPPFLESQKRRKISYTMMETEKVHHDFVARLNGYYDEVWTPTFWNKRVFQESGVNRPIFVMPLGVNTEIFSPAPLCHLPPCLMMSGDKKGVEEVPSGFLFINIFQPSFRKGMHILIPAFEEAFKNDPDTALVLGATLHCIDSLAWAIKQYARRSRIYVLTGTFTDTDIAYLYRACQAYVSSSHGEGWNMPLCEASACGLPVICPRNSAHLDLVDDESAFVVDTEGFGTIDESRRTSRWYEGMPFSLLGNKSKEQLIAHLKFVKNNYEKALERGRNLTDKITQNYTWEKSAKNILERARSFVL